MKKIVDIKYNKEYIFDLANINVDITFIKEGKTSFSTAEFNDKLIEYDGNNTFKIKKLAEKLKYINTDKQRLKITLAGSNFDLIINTFNGYIALEKGKINKLVINTKSGGVYLREMDIENCNIKTHSSMAGHVLISNSYFKDLFIETCIGDIVLKNNLYENEVSVNTVAGDIESINCECGTEKVKHKSLNGKVKIL